ncbi:MAG: DUF4080 domain-containing protein [Lachnospiraceae bacterium]|nr:DUF4080 domain-containing protein [Lachnospiraceae bacterium]
MVVLAAINAKYIHSNLAVHSLKAYAEKQKTQNLPEIRIAEFTINQQVEDILGSLYEMKADTIAFSCYIWNVDYVCRVANALKSVAPEICIWVGGPEVSYHGTEFLEEHGYVDVVMLGEGEESFCQLIHGDDLTTIPGIVYRVETGIQTNAPANPLDMDELPFVYQDMRGFEHRIVYYESSRGCPFRCSYCLSSLDKQVRFRSVELVKEELQFFLDMQVPQVKFIDRTFNCNPKRAYDIWKFICEQDNGITNFHFEISADLLTEEQMNLMKHMRPGLIQLEIGLQTTHPETIEAIHRKMDIEAIRRNVERIHAYGNIHQHLDLIAGLPYEDLEHFRTSFDEAYAMQAEELQLGFLKVLKGSFMEEQAAEYELQYMVEPPYEVLRTRWLSYADIRTLKRVEEMLEVYHNSGQFQNSLAYLMTFQKSPFDFFLQLGEYYKKKGYEGFQLKRLDRYNILREFVMEQAWETVDVTELEKRLLHDLYLRENLKKRPDWAKSYEECKKDMAKYFRLSGNKGKNLHLEPWLEQGKNGYLLYDYENRDRLHNFAATRFVSINEFEQVLSKE